MKVLVVFDSVSATKMTAKVAKTIADAMRERGVETDCFFYKDVSPAAVKSYDCLIVGSPTMAWKPTKDIMQFLEGMTIESSPGRSAAAFDTQIQMRISGNATKALESKLNELGFKLVSPPLVSYVEGKTDRYKMKEGELEKAKVWATDLANSLLKVAK
jgi:flavodoxin